jgi:hypothetical protein
MADAPRDGSTVIVLADDLSRANAFMWDVDLACWMQFTADWCDYSLMAKYSFDEDLDGYGWVPGPDRMYEDSPR